MYFLIMRHARSALLPLILLVLTSCVGTRLNQGLTALLGKPIETAFPVLGYPSNKMELSTGTVYYWSQQRTAIMPMPATANTFGTVGGTPFNASTSYTSMMPISLQGEIQIHADKAGIINNYSYNGNNGGLAPFASSLGKYANKVKKTEGVPQTQATHE